MSVYAGKKQKDNVKVLFTCNVSDTEKETNWLWETKHPQCFCCVDSAS